jgi:tetratricopeptide (TPR) repeat protein
MRFAAFFGFLLLAIPTSLPAQVETGDIKQSAGCAVAGVTGPVIVNCPQLNPRALRELNKLLKKEFATIVGDRDQRIRELTETANKWEERYFELTKSLQALALDDEMGKRAEQLLEAGELDQAGQLLDQLLSNGEKQVEAQGQYEFDRATLYALQFKPGEALKHAERADAYRPDTPKYVELYADLLFEEQQLSGAAEAYNRLLRLLRAEPDTDSSRNSAIAATLLRLSFVYTLADQTADALKADQAVLDFCRRQVHPSQACLRDEVGALSQMGFLQGRQFEFESASESLNTAVQMARELSDPEDPESREPLARSLTDLGLVEMKMGRFDSSLQHFEEAKNEYERLARLRPQRFQPALATVLNNEGMLFRRMERLDAAQETYTKALEIRSALAKADSAGFLPDEAATLNNRANLERQTGRFTQAEADYNSALAIQRGLQKNDSRLYRMDLAYTLNGLGVLYAQTNRAEQAIAPLSESLDFRYSLAAENPKIYTNDVLSGLDNLAHALHLVNKPQAISRFCQESATRLDKLGISPELSKAPAYEALCGVSSGG